MRRTLTGILGAVILLLAVPVVVWAHEYVVQPGDTLWGIAQRFGISRHALARANDLSPDALVYVGQRLYIPSAQEAADGFSTYIVRRGDTLTGIAQRFGVSLAELARVNGLSTTSYVYVGQRLRVPTGGSNGQGDTARPARRVYTVQAGDTLSAIAARFGVSVRALAEANNLRDPSRIYVGQRLVIPSQASAPGPVAGEGLQFIVSVSRQTCWLYRGRQLLYTWRCSTGRPGYPTRYGTFRIQSKIPVAYGSAWNIYMPYWLGIYWAGSTENGIHGLPWDADTGAKVWEGLVGQPVTFGCIMLEDWAASILFEMAYIGMPVIIRP